MLQPLFGRRTLSAIINLTAVRRSQQGRSLHRDGGEFSSQTVAVLFLELFRLQPLKQLSRLPQVVEEFLGGLPQAHLQPNGVEDLLDVDCSGPPSMGDLSLQD